MLNQQTLSILHSLKLFGMAKGLEERLADAKQAELSHAEFIGLLVQDEKIYRDNARLRRLLKKAKLRQEASLEDVDYGASRGLEPAGHTGISQSRVGRRSPQCLDQRPGRHWQNFYILCSGECRRQSWLYRALFAGSSPL